MGEVDLLGLLGQDLDLAARIIVALLEGLEGLGGGATEAEFGAQVGPVDLGGGAALNGSVSRYCWLLGKSRTGPGARSQASPASGESHYPEEEHEKELYVQKRPL